MKSIIIYLQLKFEYMKIEICTPKQGVPNNKISTYELRMKWIDISDIFTETKYIDFCVGISQIIERKYDAYYYRFKKDMRSEHDSLYLKLQKGITFT